jgi:hypothetical protein
MITVNSKLDKGLQFVFNDDGGYIGTQLLDRPDTVKRVKYLFEQGREVELLERNSLLDLLDEIDSAS